MARPRIDIPKIYDEVRTAYGGLGYPITGDRLVVSPQPTYNDGKPVPADVLHPNESGGNAQDDGTIRINPEYRKVMRHWKLKGSGRDFLRMIIGHELGHHIDRTQFGYSQRNARRRALLKEIADKRFHTAYTDSYGLDTDPRKLNKELLAEYLAMLVTRGEKKASFSDKVASVLLKAAAPVRAATAAPSYTVARGDTLSTIAKRNGTTWQRLAQLNGLKDPNKLALGQQLRLPPPPAAAPMTSTQRLNQVSARLHTKLNNPNLEAAILANFNRETGGKFDYATKQVGGGGYGLPQYTGPSLTAYRGWLAQNKLQDSANNQIDYFTDKYMPTRAGYKKYMAPGAQFTKEQYADWLHKRVFTPAHTIRGNKAYSDATILRHTRAHNDFMQNRLKAVNGVWTGVGR